MYVGRIVAIGSTYQGGASALYRVSSRSFPHRQAVIEEGKGAIIPKTGYEGDISKNPYIAYNCLRLVDHIAIATNGAQTDPITEKIESGMNCRDALITSLFALDYEKDKYNTPRIAAIVNNNDNTGFLGIVRKDALLVEQFDLTPGQLFYVCTYEHNAPSSNYTDLEFDAATAEDSCQHILSKGVFNSMEHAVTAACATTDKNGTFTMAAMNADS